LMLVNRLSITRNYDRQAYSFQPWCGKQEGCCGSSTRVHLTTIVAAL
jgi:hypothetical protein